jgi:hypothetical protein
LGENFLSDKSSSNSSNVFKRQLLPDCWRELFSEYALIPALTVFLVEDGDEVCSIIWELCDGVRSGLGSSSALQPVGVSPELLLKITQAGQQWSQESRKGLPWTAMPWKTEQKHSHGWCLRGRRRVKREEATEVAGIWLRGFTLHHR